MRDIWDDIAEEAIKKASEVDVPFDEFVRGLRIIKAEIGDRLNLAEDEQAVKELGE